MTVTCLFETNFVSELDILFDMLCLCLVFGRMAGRGKGGAGAGPSGSSQTQSQSFLPGPGGKARQMYICDVCQTMNHYKLKMNWE